MTTLQFETGTVVGWAFNPRVLRTGQGGGAVRLDQRIDRDYDQLPLLLPNPDSTDLPLAADYARYVGKYVDLDTNEVLDRLSDEHGLMWLTIARVAQVSVPALRKWRHGGNPTMPKKAALARLLACCEALDSIGIPDVAAWLSAPISLDHQRQRFELLLLPEGGATLLELAQDRISRREALDALDPGASTRHAPPTTEVTMDSDGIGTVHLAQA